MGVVISFFLLVSDNGFGAKTNSPDYVLRIYAVEPDFATGKVFPVDLKTGARLKSFNRQSFLELKDNQNLIPFPIVADRDTYPGSDSITVSRAIEKNRLLTGGDFDIDASVFLLGSNEKLISNFNTDVMHDGLDHRVHSLMPPSFHGEQIAQMNHAIARHKS